MIARLPQGNMFVLQSRKSVTVAESELDGGSPTPAVGSPSTNLNVQVIVTSNSNGQPSAAVSIMVRGVTERTLMSHFLGQLPEDEIVTREFVDEKDRSLAHLGRFNQLEIESQYVDGFYPGCRVRHEDYGEGEVVRLETRMRKQYVRIRFREDGERSFALEHAVAEPSPTCLQ